MRIVVSGGGTAGHISPILATVDALKRRTSELEILYIGQAGSMEARIAKAAGLEFAAIHAGKYRRYRNQHFLRKITDISTIYLNARDSLRVVRGLRQSRKLLRAFQPDVVFIKGGFVGLPVGLAAGQLGIPYLVHESDTVPGITNKILAKRAAKIAVGFPVDKYHNLPADKLVFTGNPIREGLLKAHRIEGVAAFHLTNDLPVVLIVGGSSGAETINNATLGALKHLTQIAQIIHVAGERDIQRVRFEAGRLQLSHPERYHLEAFLSENMGPALAAADLVVTRAGTNTLAELAALGKPTIVIPGSQLHDQTSNATTLARTGAVRVINEEKLSPALLTHEIEGVLASPEAQAALEKGIRTFAVHDAADQLAELILYVGGEGSA